MISLSNPQTRVYARGVVIGVVAVASSLAAGASYLNTFFAFLVAVGGYASIALATNVEPSIGRNTTEAPPVQVVPIQTTTASASVVPPTTPEVKK